MSARLLAQGVDQSFVAQRVMAMTADELLALSKYMDEMPAGEGVFGLVAMVFLVLLVTDVLGYTDVFPFVKKTVN